MPEKGWTRVRAGAALIWLRMALPAIGASALFVVLIFCVLIPSYRDSLMAARREALRAQTTLASAILDSYHSRELEGELTREVAQRRAAGLIRTLRYGPEGKDYFWINDTRPYMVMHPYRPDLEGQDLSTYRDPNGAALFLDAVRVTREHGAGYIGYVWQWQDDPRLPSRKISYVEAFEPWGWIVGTGMYVDDVHGEIAAITRGLVRVCAAAAVALLLLTGYMAARSASSEHRREAAEGRLRESERRLADIIRFLPDATMVLDSQRRVVAWNRAMEQLTGVSAEEVVGKADSACARTFHGVDRPLLADLVLAPPEDLESYYAFVAREGDRLVCEDFAPALRRHLMASAGPLRSADGEIVGAIETIMDVTPHRAAQEERERLQAQLERAQRMEAIGKLAGGIAHDFNNLLTPILGLAELLMMGAGEDSATREQLRQIMSSAERARDLTQQLLAFSRRQHLETAPIALNPVIRGMKDLLRRTIREDIEIDFDLAPDLWSARADATQLEQVLMNLAINAQDAMPTGGALRIRTENAVIGPDDDDLRASLNVGEYVKLTVSDTGAGMDAETRAHIFEPFFTTKAESGGTGLGLSTVYGIVRQHGGVVTVFSEPGAGSTFRVYLPREDAEAVQPTQHSDAGEVAGGDETILVVEDDASVRKLARKALERHGYTVLDAEGADEGMAALCAHTEAIDLLLCDVIMPGRSGPEFVAEATRVRPDLPVVFMSGYTGGLLTGHGLDADSAAFLEKPFSCTELARAVRAALDETRP